MTSEQIKFDIDLANKSYQSGYETAIKDVLKIIRERRTIINLYQPENKEPEDLVAFTKHNLDWIERKVEGLRRKPEDQGQQEQHGQQEQPGQQAS